MPFLPPNVPVMTQTTLDQQSWREGEGHSALDFSAVPRTLHIPLLAVVYGLGLALFLLVEPTKPWILLAVVALVGLGSDGILRSHPRAQLTGFADTAPYLFVPVLFALAAGLFLEEVEAVSGYRTIAAASVASVMLAAALYAEYVSVMSHGSSYAAGRLLLNILTYITAFIFFAVVYAYEVTLLPSAFAIGLFSMLLAVEIFREAEADAYRALIFSAVIGIVVAEVHWALYFISLEDFLAGVLLLMVFYQATGLIQHHLTGHLDRRIAAEFSIVTAVGLTVVIAGSVLSLG